MMLFLSCKHHNDIRNLTATLLSKVCHDVQTEYQLQLICGDVLHHRSVVVKNNATVDIRAAEFWQCSHHKTSFDVRVFNSFAATNCSSTLAVTFR